METINGIDFLLAVGVILSSVITWACTRRGEARRAGFLHELLSNGDMKVLSADLFNEECPYCVAEGCEDVRNIYFIDDGSWECHSCGREWSLA